MTTVPGGGGSANDVRSGIGSVLLLPLVAGGSHATCAELMLNTLFSRKMFAMVGK